MAYRELATLYHMDTSSSRDASLKAERERRFRADSTFDIELKTAEGDLFVATPRELSVLMEKVLRSEQECSSLMQKIPPIAQAALLRGLVLDEVVNTNAIENIHSTRAQIEVALELERATNASYRRFRELAVLYLDIADDAAEAPRSPQGIRDIYDRIMQGELSDALKPDGKIFRAEGVEITAGGVKVIHNGVEPESRIIEYMEKMLFLVARDDIPQVISALASHFLFEYAHPFYDGNGRTGRYLLALFLRKSLSPATTLSLCRAIAENKNSYYSAFSSGQNPLNRGELTFFVLKMLELIRIAQSNIADRIQTSSARFESVVDHCESFFASKSLAKPERELVFIFAQFDLFGLVKELSWDELSKHLHLGKQMTRKHAANLEQLGVIEKTSRRPLRFRLTETTEYELGITERA